MSTIDERTCLFTGQMLTPETHEEHTIPRSLCGRIRSTEVSCDQFNNDCGSFLDRHLVLPYALILNRLAPLFSSEHSQGPLDVSVPGEPDGIILGPGGIPTRRGTTILTRDPATQRPVTAVSMDEENLRRLATQLGREDSLRLSTTPVTDGNTFLHRAPIILAELEIAAIKCALLSFDHLLRNDLIAFTRSDALSDVREFIANAVSHRRIDGTRCHRYSLGLQYERMSIYERLRRQIPGAQAPFAHVVLAASHIPSRCLDLVWIVFGFDPFGFRLSYDWSGPHIGLAIVNGIFAGETASGPLPFVPDDAPLCGPTSRRAFPDEVPQGNAAAQINHEVSLHRLAAFGRAVLLLEETADSFVTDNLVEAAMLSPPERRGLRQQVTERLIRLWRREAVDTAHMELVGEIVARHCLTMESAVQAQQISDRAAADAVDWTAWLEIYRQCLRDLVATNGLPADAFTNALESGEDFVDRRQLGRLPETGN